MEGRADGRPAAWVAAAVDGGVAPAALLGARLHGPGGEAGARDDALLGAVEADAECLFERVSMVSFFGFGLGVVGMR